MNLVFVGQANYFQAHWPSATLITDSRGREHSMMFINWMPGVNDEVLEPLRHTIADVIFFFRGELIPYTYMASIPLTTRKVLISTEPLPMLENGRVLLTADRATRAQSILGGLEVFDRVYHFDPASVSYLDAAGVTNSGSFQMPVCLPRYPFPEISYSRRAARWLTGLIAKETSHRLEVCGPLKHRYGDRFLHVAHGYDDHEWTRACQACSTALNIHADSMTSVEPRIGLLMAVGVPVISEPLSVQSWFEKDRHYLEARNGDSLRYYVEESRNNPRRYEQMTEEARRYVVSEMDADLRWLQLAEAVRSS